MYSSTDTSKTVMYCKDKGTNNITVNTDHKQNIIKKEITQHKEFKKMIDAYKIKRQVYITLDEWYNHYSTILEKIFYDFINIASRHNINIKKNEYSYNDFIHMMYNESKKNIYDINNNEI